MSESAFSSLNEEITNIEATLTDLSARLRTFEAEASSTIDNDQAAMLKDLKSSVSSIQKTVGMLEGEKSAISGLLPFHPSSRQLSPDVVNRCTDTMLTKFQKLRQSTDTALKNTNRINSSYHDLDVQVDKLRSDLRSVNRRAQSNLSSAKEQLGQKRRETNEAEQTREQLRSSLVSLENEMESQKEDRNVVRVFRVAAWVGTVLFPPVAGVAVGLEIAAAAMREKRDDLQAQISLAETKRNSLQSQVDTLNRQQQNLSNCVSTAQSLLSRADKILNTSASTKTLVSNKLHEYQHLKEATDEFAQWSTKAHDHIGTIGVLCDDEKSLRRMTRRFVNTLAVAQIGSLTYVLSPLKTIEFSEEIVDHTR